MQRQPLFTTLAPLILASSSPRRQQMLQTMGLRFTIIPAYVDESHQPGEPPRDFALRLARDKARAVASMHPDAWVLGADTVVSLEGKILDKPRDPDDALATLRQLTGRTHQVMTAICLCFQAQRIEEAEVETTSVTFTALPDQILAAYVATGEPLDKAGAYGIQGAGAALVRRIEGSCANVIGLPIDRVIALLLEHHVITATEEHPRVTTNTR